jgi:hypothetical protein
MKTTVPSGFQIGVAGEEVLVQVVDENDAVLEQMLFEPDGADAVAADLNKFAAMARARKQGAAGSA